MTQHHRLVVTGNDAVPTQVSKGRKIPRLDIATTQEEADLIITQQAIHLAKEDGESLVCVLCDDTDVFALLVYFFSMEQLHSSMMMESPIHGRSCIDIKETARQHDAIIPAILPLHALTGCDSVYLFIYLLHLFTQGKPEQLTLVFIGALHSFHIVTNMYSMYKT